MQTHNVTPFCATIFLLNVSWALGDFYDNGVTAHRGNAAEFPENTLAAVSSALSLGVDWIEVDVRITRDGQLVVIHDATTARVAGVDVHVATSTYDRLKRVDVAHTFREEHRHSVEACPHQFIPLLSEIITLVAAQNKTRLSIQPKTDCVEQIVSLAKSMNAVRWIGFNDTSRAKMATAKRLMPNATVFWDRDPLSSIAGNVTPQIATAVEHGFQCIVLHDAGVSRAKIDQIHDAGLEAGVWTVNDRERMNELLGLGIDRFYTDNPRQLIEILSVPRLVLSGAKKRAFEKRVMTALQRNADDNGRSRILSLQIERFTAPDGKECCEFFGEFTARNIVKYSGAIRGSAFIEDGVIGAIDRVQFRNLVTQDYDDVEQVWLDEVND